MLLRTLPALHKFPALGTVALPQPHSLNHRFARHLHGSSHHRDPREGSAFKVAVPCSKTPLAKSAIAYSQSSQRSQRSSRIYLQSAIMTVDFTSIPMIDLAEANNPVTKSQVLEQLRHVLLNVGFLYISNHGVPEQSIQDLVNALPNLFDLTEKEKDEVALHNSPHFLGYSGTGTETTAGKADSREQFEFATELEDDWIEGKPLAERLKGPNQWPSAYPSLRSTVEAYIASLTHLSERFLALVAEALSLPSQTFAPFLSDQHRLKLVHYPESEEAGQGVGPHKDSSGWWTFLLQASPPHVKGLQVLNRRGDWIDVPNVPGTFVVNIGQGFEVVTNGVCKATTHRVISGPEERFSVPFFQGLRRSLTKEEATGQLKEHFGRAEFGGTGESEEGRRIDSAFLRGRYDTWGESQLRTKIRSHPDVGRKCYGDISDEYFHEK